MNEPTKEQIQWFWEQCGWKQQRVSMAMSPEVDGWENPIPETSFDKYQRNLPPIDLNNLFKYAVPKVERGVQITQTIDGWECDIGLGDITTEHKDLALAVFWAIYKAFGGA